MKWKPIESDAEFRALFEGASIVRATGDSPDHDAPYADVFWHMSDGRIVAMEVEAVAGCPTCGDATANKSYWLFTP